MRRFLLLLTCATVLLCLVAAPALAATTVTVRPSGGDDTKAIQRAFCAAIKAGPGSTVRLTAGHFYMNNILVQNFRGCFTGAGKGVTIIDTVRGNPGKDCHGVPYALHKGVTLTRDPRCPGTYIEPFAFLIGFRGGNVRVCNMSFNITPPHPAEPFFGGRTDLGDVVVVTGNASSSFDRVGFTAGNGENAGSNVAGDIAIMGKGQALQDGTWISFGRTGGHHRVTRCSFASLSGVEVVGLKAGSSLVVGGCATMRNVFNVDWEGCALIDVSNSYVEVSHNRMTAVAGGIGVLVFQGWMAGWGNGAPLPPLPAPHYVISDNCMSASDDTGAGVWLIDLSYPMYGAAGRLDALIARNTIVLKDTFAGVTASFAKNIKVLNNRISGTASAGVYIGDDQLDGGSYFPVSGWKIIGNDLRNLTASVAPIYLGEGTTHCYVVCPTMTDVLDKGVDNILVNAHRM